MSPGRLARSALEMAVRVLAAVALGTALLTAAYLLPTEPMQVHMDSSARTILAEGTYPSVFRWCTSRLDNYTDTIILMNAAYDSGESPEIQAMTVAMPGVSGAETPVDVLAAHYGQGKDYDESRPYYQYWHGYLLFIKPLLLLTDYRGIRILNAVGQVLTVAAVALLLFRQGQRGLVGPYLLSLLFLAPWVLPRSLQFSSCFYLMNLGMLAVLLAGERLEKKAGAIFCWLGIATAYFDFLTYPIAVLGIPAALCFCLRGRQPVGKTLGEGAGITLAWGFGYGAMWAGKWVVGSLLTGQNILATAGDKLLERSSLNAEMEGSLGYSLRVALTQNIKYFIRTPAILLLAVALVLLAFGILKRWRWERPGGRAVFETVLPFAILALFPFAWYLATANHSGIHCWFTNKALIVSVFAALCALKCLGTAGGRPETPNPAKPEREEKHGKEN